MNHICPACGKNLEIADAQALDRHGSCPSCGADLFPASTHTYAGGTPPPPPADLLKSGEVLGGYVIERLIGRGGMGSVYLAVQQSLGRKVAVKVLGEEYAKDPAFVQRFVREASALANLNHPNIVGIHDKGMHEGRYYIVMEYVEGVSLRDVLAQRKLDPVQALKIVPLLCDALEYAHGQGILHRDIKPENILMAKSGQVKIADFGLARLTQGDSSLPDITHTHQVMGTRDYMAPEARLSAKNSDHRADIYSLGVVFYEMLTGELPIGKFSAPSRKVQVDVRLDEVVLRTLEADPAMRYQRAGEVGRDVTQITGTGTEAAFAAAPASPAAPGKPRLTVRKEGKILGGVFSGIAQRYGWEPIWLRLGFVLVCLIPKLTIAEHSTGINLFGGKPMNLGFAFLGAGLLSYLFLWVFMPKEDAAGTALPRPTAKLTRPKEGRVLTGVCAGIAQRYGWEPVLVRLAFVVTTFVPCGLGLLAYLFCWIAIPSEDAGASGKGPLGCLLATLLVGACVVLGCTVGVLAFMNPNRAETIAILVAGLLSVLLLAGAFWAFRKERSLLGILAVLAAGFLLAGLAAVAWVSQHGGVKTLRKTVTTTVTALDREHGGVRITGVDPGEQASALGLRVGDRIVEYDGQPVQDGASLRHLIVLAQALRPGQGVRVKVKAERGPGTILTINVIARPGPLGIRVAEDVGGATPPPIPPSLTSDVASSVKRIDEAVRDALRRKGLEPAEPFGILPGPAKVRITAVPPEVQADLKPGDMVLSYDGARVDNPVHLGDLMTMRKGTAQVPMVLLRDGKEIRLLLPGGRLEISTEAVR